MLSIHKLIFNFLDFIFKNTKKNIGSLKFQIDIMDYLSLTRLIASSSFCDLKSYQGSRSPEFKINLPGQASFITMLESRYIICFKNKIIIKFSEYRNICNKKKLNLK